MIYGSVCSGIEAASVAWHPLGWRPGFFSEIDAFARALLKHRFPGVPLHGDFTTIEDGDYEPIDILVGGTPCQDFSVAGLRAGLDGERGALTLQFLALARRLRPKWVVWENVPGLLSIDGGRAFGSFLRLLGECGYGFAYRVLDAQHFGVPQRRRRVFVVGHLGDWRPAAAVLFERASLQGHPAPRREAGQGIARPVASGAPGSSGYRNDADTADSLIAGTIGANGKAAGSATQQDAESGLLVADTVRSHPRPGSNSLGLLAFGGNNQAGPIDVATACNAHGGPHGRLDFESEPFVAHAFDARQSDTIQYGDKTGPLDTDGHTMVIAFSAKDHGADAMEELSPTLRAGGHDQSHANAGVMPAVAFHENQRAEVTTSDTAGSLKTGGGKPGQGYPAIMQNGGDHSHAEETGPGEALRALLGASDEEAFREWCLGVVAAFWPAEVLRCEMHGRRFRCEAQPQRGLVNVTLARSQAGATWTVLDLWQAGCDGRPSCRWGPSEQLAAELGSYLSRLPYAPSPAQRFLRSLRQTAEGSRLLREALSALEEARRSLIGGDQSTWTGRAVRRLMAEECEALQGFPRGYTLVSYRGKPAADGPRYHAIGNSMAVPVMSWLGRRIEAVEEIMERGNCVTPGGGVP